MGALERVGFTQADFFQLKQQSNSLPIIEENAEKVARIIEAGVEKAAMMQLALNNEGKLREFINQPEKDQTADKIVQFISDAQHLRGKKVIEKAGFTKEELSLIEERVPYSLHVLVGKSDDVVRIIERGVRKEAIMSLALTDYKKLEEFVHLPENERTKEKIIQFIKEAEEPRSE